MGVAIAEHFPSGSVDNRPVTSPDIAAAVLDLAGLPIDEKADGVSVLGWLHKPGTAARHENIFWRMSGGKMALHSGNWKIVRPKQNASIELYHLLSDPSDNRNLVSQHPGKFQELTEQFHAMNAQMQDPICLPR